jgi:hypothetical protein
MPCDLVFRGVRGRGRTPWLSGFVGVYGRVRTDCDLRAVLMKVREAWDRIGLVGDENVDLSDGFLALTG